VLEVLDAAGLRRWTELARDALGRHRVEIDALNVFPVPDGDTGTNMFLTAEAAVVELSAERDRLDRDLDLSETGHSLVRGTVLGARGNSGVILAQYLQGFTDLLDTERSGVTASARQVAAAFGRAADSAYAAVASPREGTILTVARAVAEAAATPAAQVSLPALVAAVADAAAVALARTPEQLEVLARAGVVDAGGKGLVVVLESLVEVVTGHRRVAGPAPVAFPFDLHEFDEGGGAFEVMYLLDADDSAIPSLRESLEALGDSLVVVGTGRLWNVHVHTDDVGAVVEAGINAGRPHDSRVSKLRDDKAADSGVDSERLADGRGVVAVAHGSGTAALLESSGATVVRAYGRAAPSMAEFLDAITRAGVKEIVLLPSASNIRAAAESAAQAAREQGLRISLVPTRSIVQTLAAVAVHESAARFEDDVVSMTRAAGATRYAGVSIASRAAVTSAGRCAIGDVLGIVESDVVEIGESVDDVAMRVLARLLSTGGELVTIVRGDDADDTMVSAFARTVRRKYPVVEVVVYDGGQPFWPLIIGVE